MDLEENQISTADPEVVDPEVRAYVYSLVSAVRIKSSFPSLRH